MPLIEELATATADELKKGLDPITVTLANANGPQGRVKIGGLWSMVSEQSIGELNNHRVMPLASLSWLQTMVMVRPTHVVSTPLASAGEYWKVLTVNPRVTLNANVIRTCNEINHTPV